MPATSPPAPLRPDLLRIARLIAPGSRILDVGCGDCDLLSYLGARQEVDGRGIEISRKGVNACVSRGLAVVQGDADNDLGEYPDKAFDTVVLSQTLQATRRPREVLRQLTRLGRRAIVTFPNFGHWRVRLQLLAQGRMPITATLDATWYRTPNIHLCTIRDFVALCDSLGLNIERLETMAPGGHSIVLPRRPLAVANILADQALFVLRRG